MNHVGTVGQVQQDRRRHADREEGAVVHAHLVSGDPGVVVRPLQVILTGEEVAFADPVRERKYGFEACTSTESATMGPRLPALSTEANSRRCRPPCEIENGPAYGIQAPPSRR